jgi:hypothetical protein
MPQKVNNTTSTHPKATQKTNKEVTKKDDAKTTNVGFNAQTYEKSFEFRKYQQEIKQHC